MRNSSIRGAASCVCPTGRKGAALSPGRRHSRVIVEITSSVRKAKPFRTESGKEALLTAHCLLTLLFLLLTAHCSLLTANAAWTRQRIPSMAWLHSVFFLDQNRGWVVGSRGTLLTTDDGGNRWRTLSRPTEDNIRDVYFFDEQNGIIVCERNIYELTSNDEQRAYLMKTTDAGERWQRLEMRGADIDARIARAVFNNRGRGWVFGEAGAVYATSDAGTSWIKLHVPTRSLLLGGAVIDDESAWLVGAGSTVLQTLDGGESWQHARIPAVTNIRFNAASFIERRLGWIVGSGGAIYRTINGGRFWQAQNSGVENDLFDVRFLNAAEGWAVGAEGVLLRTTDGGTHWLQEKPVTDHTLERVFFSDSKHGWAVGFGGTIIAFNSTDPLSAPRLKY